MNVNINNSELNNLIPPEIKNDAFYAAIQRIAREEDIKTILEIGSSSGEGSTEAFVTGIQQNPNKPILFCMEVSKTRFAELDAKYKNNDCVKCYNVSSVSIDKFPTEADVVNFYYHTPSALNNYSLEQVLRWLQQDIKYIEYSEVTYNGIKEIRQENNIDFFDVVLIDGSEFTGNAEFIEIYGAKFICLDDINTFENHNNHQKLLEDKNYSLVAKSLNTRNGFSIFKRIEKIDSDLFITEACEKLLLSKLIRPGMIVFDVGANIGDYSILLSKFVGKSGRVYSFEPASSTFKKLQKRIENTHCCNVFLYQKAIYSKKTFIELNEFPDEYSAWNSIGIPQMVDPKNLSAYVPIVNIESVEATTLNSFCEEHEIKKIDYLKLDVEGAESDALEGAIELLQKKAIQFLQFEISQKMLEGMNRTAKNTFDILIENGYECHCIEENGDIGKEIKSSNSFYENYIAFPSLPVHFFTIVLNGEPFIRYHIEIFKQLPFKWHWHIIEGVAALKHDSAWSIRLGGHITDEMHLKGRSHDGTTTYLDELAQHYPENITVYRKPEGSFWDGKREMVNEPLSNIHEECLLWQIDADELWTVEQICTARQLFINNPNRTAAFYWSWYFVGENLVVSTRNCYSQNPHQEWLRTWRYKPGAVWVSHEPPTLAEPLPNGQWRDIAKINPFLHHETENQGLVFQHFAYVIPTQLYFKEQYYGYKNAFSQWEKLQAQAKFPTMLSEYFSWVKDATQVDTTESCGIVPIAQKKFNSDDWQFLHTEELKQASIKIKQLLPVIIVDGVFFQLYKTGIARVWKSLFEEWVENGFAKHIIVLDRAGTAPKIPGIRYRTVPAYDYNATDADRTLLQQVCDEEGADIFVSSYYTTPLSTPSVFVAYDMIPEVMEWDLNHHMWREKHHAIQHASAYIAISENTARDLRKFFPHTLSKPLMVAPCGVKKNFVSASPQEIYSFKTKYGIAKPYFILVGSGGYKNTILFFKAFAQLCSKQGFEIVCTGGGWELETELRNYTSGSVVHMLQLSDQELSIAYSGAVALVYPSKYEGFGLPILEAIACGCPVITCANGSIPEVAGDAAIYVNDDDADELADALCEVQKPSVRNSLIAAGLEQAKHFSWAKMADTVSSALVEATLLPLNLKQNNIVIFPDWSQPEEALCTELLQVIQANATHPNSSQTTLLVDNGEISEEEANLILSSVAMNLLMEEDLDISEGLEISLVGHLSEMQWKALLPKIKARIILANENQAAIAHAKAEIPSCELDKLLEAEATMPLY